MIRLLDQAELGHMEELRGRHFCECRIKAMAKAYGAGYEWVRFYADEQWSTLLCMERGSATLFCRESLPNPDTEGLLMAAATEVLSEIPLVLPGFYEEKGLVFGKKFLSSVQLEGVSSRIADAYEILFRIFPNEVNQTCFPEWYADLSHRIRHGMSRIYTLPGKCTATLSCRENGALFLSQLGTLLGYRRQGLAAALIGHIAAESDCSGPVVLLSRDMESDEFYRHIGFLEMGNWYYYRRQ